MNPTTNKGFLMLADITGFTPFMAKTELEHAQEILGKMLKSIISFLTPTFKLAEVEGDAVFVYADKLPGKEVVLEIIETIYFNFRDRRASYNRMRTCNCKACEMASTLDLKFFVHYGDYIMSDVGGKRKPVGPSVNVIHRLLKNHVTEITGWKAYALFTKECLDVIQMNSGNLHIQQEAYEHIGEVDTFSINLEEQYQNYLTQRMVFLPAEDADLVVSKEFNVSPPLLWEWSNDPKKRTLWSEGSDWQVRSRPNTTTRRGSSNHCVNSKVIEQILDYRPFQYYTSSIGRGSLNFTLTVKFDEIESGTRLSWHVKMNGTLPKFITRTITKIILVKGMQVHKNFEKLKRLVEADEINQKAIA